MPASVRCAVDQLGTCLLVRLAGELSVATAPAVRTALVKHLVEQPDALLVDLSGLAIGEAQALSVFAAVRRQAALWPATPVLICRPDPPMAAQLAAGRYGRVEVFDTVAEAMTAASARRLSSIDEVLLPVTGATGRARDLVADACGMWDLPRLAGPASLVAAELVGNAVEHAGTMLSVRLTLTRRYLIIAVRDGSTAPPRWRGGAPADVATGRGLMLVDAVARRWGSLVGDEGKVVWATVDRTASPEG